MRQLVTKRKVEALNEIPGADRIEVARVDGWQCVVKKGEFKVGDEGLYFEIDSFLPVLPVFSFLGPNSLKKMDEHQGYRIKTMRLKQQLSQGLLLPLNLFPELDFEKDLSLQLNVLKYEKPIPVDPKSQIKGNFPSFIPKTEQERVQNLVSKLPFHKETFEVTEKLDGTSMTVYEHEGHFGVCGRNWEFEENPDSHFWKLAEAFRGKLTSMAIQGECIGAGVQGNPYKLAGKEFRVFDAYDIKEHRYLTSSERFELLASMGLTHLHVPLMRFAESLGEIQELLSFAEGVSALAQVPREGLVYKANERKNGEIFSFKVISNDYLLRED